MFEDMGVSTVLESGGDFVGNVGSMFEKVSNYTLGDNQGHESYGADASYFVSNGGLFMTMVGVGIGAVPAVTTVVRKVGNTVASMIPGI